MLLPYPSSLSQLQLDPKPLCVLITGASGHSINAKLPRESEDEEPVKEHVEKSIVHSLSCITTYTPPPALAEQESNVDESNVRFIPEEMDA